jgi:hypothetical protein
VDADLVIARDKQMPGPAGVPPELLPLFRRFKISVPDDLVIARDKQTLIEQLARDNQKTELLLKEALKGLSRAASHIRKKETERNIETNERPEAPPPRAEPVRSSVPSPQSTNLQQCAASSPIRESLRIFLTDFPGRFGLPTLPDDRALDAIAAHLPTDAALWRFSDLVTRQKPKPNGGGWMYFVTIAIACEKAWQADEDLVKRALLEQRAKAERWRSEAAADPDPEAAGHIAGVTERAGPPVDPERDAGAAAVRAARAAEVRLAKERRVAARREAGSGEGEKAKGQGG